MKIYKRLFPVNCVFLLISGFNFAQNTTKEFNEIKEKYSSKQFQYTVEPPPKTPKDVDFTWLDRLFSFLNKINWEYVLYGFIGLVFLLVLYKLYQNGLIFKYKKEHAIDSEEEHFNFIEENLLNVDLNEWIKTAKSTQNYRLAIRYYHYLNTQNLAQKDLLNWDPKKTNQQLAHQIKNQKIKTFFEQNTSIFYQVWFGNFEIDQEKFEEFEQYFNQLNDMI